MKLSDPQLVRTSLTRYHYTFPEDEVARANTAFAQCKQHKNEVSTLVLSVLWTSTNLIQIGGPQYIFNHFVLYVSNVVKPL